MGDAVRQAFALAPPGGVVLLAPACSSFDMFRDYAARGRAFKDEVRKLKRTCGRLRERKGGRMVRSAKAVNSHQIGRGGEEPAAGNTGRSGL